MSEAPEQQGPIDPFVFLQQFPEAPSKEQIAAWKQQTPGNRVRMFTSIDSKRVYIMRGISAVELGKVQAEVVNLPGAQTFAPEKLHQEIQIAVVARCCVWTSATTDHKLTDQALRASGSGLAPTLHEVVAELSDYMPPEIIDRLSCDL